MWVEAGFPPETFWQQTQRSFSNALAGAARARTSMAWQVAAMVGAAFVGKLKDLDEYLPVRKNTEAVANAKLLSSLFQLKAKGIAMTIEKVDRKAA